MKASGPGGQGVNTTDSAVELRFYPDASSAFSADEKARIRTRLATRISADGALIVRANRRRSQLQNRADAQERLAGLLRGALEQQRSRRRTRPTLGSKRRRLDAKRQRGETKRLRRPPDASGG